MAGPSGVSASARTWRARLAAAVFLGVAASAAAQPASAPPAPKAEDAPSIRVGTMVFADYTVTEAPRATDVDGNEFTPNAFNISRAYLNVTGTISRAVAFRVTPDVVRETGPGSAVNGSLVFRLKYAYAQFNLDQWMTRGSFVRFGMQQTPWIDFLDSVYRYRFQGPVFEDREGLLSSADVGATVRYVMAGDYGDVHGGFYNGDHYNRVEPNDRKAFMLRGTVRPLPGHPLLRGLRITGFHNRDAYVREAARRRSIAAVTYEHPNVHAGFNYLAATDRVRAASPELGGRGFSIWATPKTARGWGWEGLLRVDRFTQEQTTSASDAARDRTIAGVAYWFPRQGNVSAAILFDHERVDHDGHVPARPAERRWAVRTLISF